jgi:serine/threonine protein phosphatase PrpC
MAHEKCRQALLAVDTETYRLVGNVPVDEYEPGMLESVDGGTTATIIALLDGATLVMAQVGDSSALLGGTIRGDEGDDEVAFEELMEEHSATNVKEYVRVKESGPRGQALNFVYDVHDLIEKGKLDQCAIFKKSNGQFEMDVRSKRLAEVHGTPAKNARGDLPAILLTPENDEPPFESMEPQSLAMTRSLGDFYMHTFGVTWKPEVISVDLAEQCGELDHLTLILCSDGIWDLWEYEQVFQAIVSAPKNGQQSFETARKFFEASIVKGTEMFEDTADNMTGIVVYLHPKGIKAPDPSTVGSTKPLRTDRQGVPLEPPEPPKPEPKKPPAKAARGDFSV